MKKLLIGSGIALITTINPAFLNAGELSVHLTDKNKNPLFCHSYYIVVEGGGGKMCESKSRILRCSFPDLSGVRVKANVRNCQNGGDGTRERVITMGQDDTNGAVYIPF